MASIEIIEWQALEYEHRKKSSDWFWVVGIIGMVLVVFATVFKNFLFAILLLIGTFAVLLYGARPPETISFGLLPKGVRIKDRLYPYSHLKSFWVTEEPGREKIIVESDRLILPHLVLPLGGELSHDHARDYLLQYLPEVKHDESLADVLSDYLGF